MTRAKLAPPFPFLRGQGYERVSKMSKRSTTEDFARKSRLIFGDEYLYDKVNYVDSHTDVLIGCRKHGYFLKSPTHHLGGQGCPFCTNERLREMFSMGADVFKEKATATQGDKYDYSLITEDVFVNVNTKVPIICKRCGEIFPQTPSAHLSGQGCPTCAKASAAKKRKNTPVSRNRPVCGVGINDYCGVAKDENGKDIASYRLWHNALSRCYNSKVQSKHTTYIGCSVCDEWLHYTAFKAWFDDPANGYMEGYHLDKDIIAKGNKTYSPSTCCFVPSEINSMFTNSNSRRGAYPVGVSYWKGKYKASVTHGDGRTYLGLFNTPEEAFAAYKVAKETYIKEVAEKHYREGKITERVYIALIIFKVEITD